MHTPEALQPDGVEELALARLARLILGDLDVAVERIGDEIDLSEPLRRAERATRRRSPTRRAPICAGRSSRSPGEQRGHRPGSGNLYAIAAA
jgi:hypothetical protein